MLSAGKVIVESCLSGNLWCLSQTNNTHCRIFWPSVYEAMWRWQACVPGSNNYVLLWESVLNQHFGGQTWSDKAEKDRLLQFSFLQGISEQCSFATHQSIQLLIASEYLHLNWWGQRSTIKGLSRFDVADTVNTMKAFSFSFLFYSRHI